MAKDLLIDILAEMPGLFEDMDRMREMDDEDESRELLEADLRKRCRRCDIELVTWNKDWNFEDKFMTIAKRLKDNLSAEDLAIVYLTSIAWATALLLYSTMRDLGADLERLGPRAKLFPYIHKISHCTRYFLHPSTGKLGKEMASFPLGLAMQFLGNPVHQVGEEEREIIHELFNSERGKEIREFIMSLQRESAWPALKGGSGDGDGGAGAGADGEQKPSGEAGKWAGAWPLVKPPASPNVNIVL